MVAVTKTRVGLDLPVLLYDYKTCNAARTPPYLPQRDKRPAKDPKGFEPRPLLSQNGYGGRLGVAAEVQEVLAVLSKVVDPELAGDVVSLGYVRDLRADKGAGTVEMTLSLESQFNPYAKLLQEACRERIASLHWVYDDAGAVTVTLDADDITGQMDAMATEIEDKIRAAHGLEFDGSADDALTED